MASETHSAASPGGARETDPLGSRIGSQIKPPPQATQGHLIGSVRKNSREEFRLALGNYNGKTQLEIRVWARRYGGEFVATPRAIVLPLGSISDLIAALHDARGGAR